MIKTNPKVDEYLAEGCGRCELVGTPACKINNWREEMTLLRAILLDCELIEERKWGVACYMFENNNLILLSAFKDYCSLTFFKGALLKDPHNVLYQQSENSQATRLLRFTSIQQVNDMETTIRDYIQEAIEIERTGLQVEYKKELDLPEELLVMMDEMPEFKDAFEALTPGRQRGYSLYFSAPKQSKTRTARIEKYMDKIFEGKGINDR